jgi:hypothetical protein
VPAFGSIAGQPDMVFGMEHTHVAGLPGMQTSPPPHVEQSQIDPSG